MQILGIKLTELRKRDVLNKIESFLLNNNQDYIVTPNPEIILQADKDEEFFYILNKSSLSVPDGIGLKFASWTMFKNLFIYPGADLTKDLLSLADSNNYKVGVINWSKGLSKKEDIEKSLKLKYVNLDFKVLDIERSDKKIDSEILRELNSFGPDILFCGLGAPWQEKFIFHNLSSIPTVKLAIGVGASIDYLSGQAKRAPLFFRKLGFEWLWRLFGIFSRQKKSRKKRIFNAVIIFVYKFLKWRFIMPFLYRKNVACLLYKKVGNNYKVLIVERRDEDSHWQLPQGGLDEQDIVSAGIRELREELNTDKFKYIAHFKNLYKYEFFQEGLMKKTYRGGSIQKHLGYKGQKQSLLIAEFFGDDSDIKVNFWDHKNWKWIEVDGLVKNVHEVRRKSTEKYLKKFKSIV